MHPTQTAGRHSDQCKDGNLKSIFMADVTNSKPRQMRRNLSKITGFYEFEISGEEIKNKVVSHAEPSTILAASTAERSDKSCKPNATGLVSDVDLGRKS